MAPDGLQMAPNGSRWAPDGSRWAPDGSRWAPDCSPGRALQGTRTISTNSQSTAKRPIYIYIYMAVRNELLQRLVLFFAPVHTGGQIQNSNSENQNCKERVGDHFGSPDSVKVKLSKNGRKRVGDHSVSPYSVKVK